MLKINFNLNFKRLKLLNERGQGLTEYITLLVLVSLVSVGVATTLGKTIRTKVELANKHLKSDINFEDVNK